MGFVWQTTPERAWSGLAEAYSRAIQDGIYQLAQAYAVEIEGWMKENASWVDRTGAARQTLNTEAQRLVSSAVEIILAGGVEYQVYLELSYGGNFAIIGPALDHFIPLVWRDVQELLR